jgi:hypothetical protein
MIDSGNEYVIAVKANQKNLHRQIRHIRKILNQRVATLPLNELETELRHALYKCLMT